MGYKQCINRAGYVQFGSKESKIDQYVKAFNQNKAFQRNIKIKKSK